MAGIKNGVATKIKEFNQACLYTHCYGHSLNLAVGDTIKGIKHLTDTFEMIRAICKLIKSHQNVKPNSNPSKKRHKVRQRVSIQYVQQGGQCAEKHALQSYQITIICLDCGTGHCLMQILKVIHVPRYSEPNQRCSHSIFSLAHT